MENKTKFEFSLIAIFQTLLLLLAYGLLIVPISLPISYIYIFLKILFDRKQIKVEINKKKLFEMFLFRSISFVWMFPLVLFNISLELIFICWSKEDRQWDYLQLSQYPIMTYHDYKIQFLKAKLYPINGYPVKSLLELKATTKFSPIFGIAKKHGHLVTQTQVKILNKRSLLENVIPQIEEKLQLDFEKNRLISEQINNRVKQFQNTIKECETERHTVIWTHDSSYPEAVKVTKYLKNDVLVLQCFRERSIENANEFHNILPNQIPSHLKEVNSLDFMSAKLAFETENWISGIYYWNRIPLKSQEVLLENFTPKEKQSIIITLANYGVDASIFIDFTAG